MKIYFWEKPGIMILNNFKLYCEGKLDADESWQVDMARGSIWVPLFLLILGLSFQIRGLLRKDGIVKISL